MNTKTVVPTEDRLLRIKQAASRLNVSEKTVRRLIDQEKLPSVKIGGLRMIRESDLDAFLEDLRAQPQAAKQQPRQHFNGPIYLVVKGEPWDPCDPWGDDPFLPRLEIQYVAPSIP
jgi:excisionase family DNA binding protein